MHKAYLSLGWSQHSQLGLGEGRAAQIPQGRTSFSGSSSSGAFLGLMTTLCLWFSLSARSVTCISVTKASCVFTCVRSTGPSPTPRCNTACPPPTCLPSSPKPAEAWSVDAFHSSPFSEIYPKDTVTLYNAHHDVVPLSSTSANHSWAGVGGGAWGLGAKAAPLPPTAINIKKIILLLLLCVRRTMSAKGKITLGIKVGGSMQTF